MSPKERKVVQVACSETPSEDIRGLWVIDRTIVALCDDGTVWVHIPTKDPGWLSVPAIPQSKETK